MGPKWLSTHGVWIALSEVAEYYQDLHEARTARRQIELRSIGSFGHFLPICHMPTEDHQTMAQSLREQYVRDRYQIYALIVRDYFEEPDAHRPFADHVQDIFSARLPADFLRLIELQRSADDDALYQGEEHDYTSLLHRFHCAANAASPVMHSLQWDTPQGRATLQAALTGRIALEQGQDPVTAALTALDVGQYASRNCGLETWEEEPWAILVVAWLAAMVILEGTDVNLRSAFHDLWAGMRLFLHPDTIAQSNLDTQPPRPVPPNEQVHLGHTRPARSALARRCHVCARTYVPVESEGQISSWLQCSLCHAILCNTPCSNRHAPLCSAARRPLPGCRPCLVIRHPTNRSPADSVESVSSEPDEREAPDIASPMDTDEFTPPPSPDEDRGSPVPDEALNADPNPPWRPSDVPQGDPAFADSDGNLDRPSGTESPAVQEFEANRTYLIQIAYQSIAITAQRNAGLSHRREWITWLTYLRPSIAVIPETLRTVSYTHLTLPTTPYV